MRKLYRSLVFAFGIGVVLLYLATARAEINPCDDGNPCTIDVQLFGNCYYYNAQYGTSCDDGQYCNGEDICDGEGHCIHRNPPDCSYLDTPCQRGYCDENANQCNVQFLAAGTPCDDGLFCTVDDVCDGEGTCVSGSPRNCKAEMGGTDPGQCLVWACDEDADECVPAAGHEGEPCDDGLFCTVGDRCENGDCRGEARDCSAATGGCLEGICDEDTDQCVPGNPLPAGTPCDDGKFCTVGETCDGAGHCGGGSQRDCSYLNTSCAQGVCNEETDECEVIPKPEDTYCDDGLFCTINDHCDGEGNCVGDERDCSSIGTQCAPGVCDEDLRTCVKQPLEAGTPCDDGRFCTIDDICDGEGHCVGGSTNPCDDGIECTLDRCNPNIDVCEHIPQPCDDGNPCTFNDICDTESGGCTGTPRPDGYACTLPGGRSGVCIDGECRQGCTSDSDCDDGIECTIESCDFQTHTCIIVPESRICDDGLFCNGEEICDVEQGCIAGTPPDCDDGIDCTQDWCNESRDRCEHTPRDEVCDDGLFCNGDEICDPQLGCLPANEPRDCDDGIDCTIDSCDEQNKQCVHTPDDSVCSDGVFCNGEEKCSPTQGCIEGAAPDCNDYIDCTTDYCDETEDRCVHEPDDSLCSDGIFCNGDEVCDPLVGCRPGTARDCDDGIDCTQDSCNYATDECEHVPVDALCDDGAFCNGMERCDAELGCVAGEAIACDDGIACTIDSCNEETDECTYTPIDDLCNDGKFCTGIERCDPHSGCYSAELPNCDDGIDCTLDLCDASLDQCVHEPIHSQCDDNNPCTEDVCSLEEGCTSSNAPDGLSCRTPSGASGVCLEGECTVVSDGDEEPSEIESDFESEEELDFSDVETVIPCRRDEECTQYGMVCDRELGFCVEPGVAGLCEACISDLNCQEPGARCIPWTEDGSGVCGRPCSIVPIDPACPELYRCKEVPTLSGEWTTQCVPLVPDRDCVPPSDGDFERPEEEYLEFPDLPDEPDEDQQDLTEPEVEQDFDASDVDRIDGIDDYPDLDENDADRWEVQEEDEDLQEPDKPEFDRSDLLDSADLDDTTDRNDSPDRDYTNVLPSSDSGDIESGCSSADGRTGIVLGVVWLLAFLLRRRMQHKVST